MSPDRTPRPVFLAHRDAVGRGASTPSAQAQSHRPALISELHGGHERRLAWRASPGFPPAALPAPIRIIELHPAAQRARVVTLLHHLHQLVLDLPGGVVAHRKLPRQLQRRDPVLRLRHQVHRQEPGAKWQLGARQNRARGQRHLVPAATALIQRPTLVAPVPGMLASRAHEPVRPTPTKQRLGALLLAPVLVQELHQTVALLKLNPIARHHRLPIFQLLATIRGRLAHKVSFVRNQVISWRNDSLPISCANWSAHSSSGGRFGCWRRAVKVRSASLGVLSFRTGVRLRSTTRWPTGIRGGFVHGVRRRWSCM